MGTTTPEAKSTEPEVEEKDILPSASKEWNQPAITRAMKVLLGPGFENLFNETEKSTNSNEPSPQDE